MRPFGILLTLMLAVHVTAQPIDGDYSSSVQDKTLDYTKRDEPAVQPRQLDGLYDGLYWDETYDNNNPDVNYDFSYDIQYIGAAKKSFR